MFSGLTNQVTSWMGNVKGDHEEKVPTPTEDSNVLLSPDKKDDGSSPTKPPSGGRLEMFSNVKNQIEGIGGWLGSSIPKLRKGENEGLTGEGGEDNLAATDEALGTSSVDPTKSSLQKDDDDNSSATGGADSGPGTPTDSPTQEEKDGHLGNVQSKALAGAKSFGSFLYSAVNKAGKTVSEGAAKIKETVEKNSILGEFNKEQEAFMKAQGDSATPLPPWTGCSNEEALKDECLSLSQDRRNFVRSPPAGVDFQFDYSVSYPVAMAIMEQDPNLEKMRYELVPKVITEENFWRNYFYRVSLICQANELSYMSREGDSQSMSDNQTFEQPIDSQNRDAHEFVSDTLQTRSEDLAEVQEGMKKLAFGSRNEEEWEKELEAELQDYELVNENKAILKSDNWEQEIDDMLSEETDLK